MTDESARPTSWVRSGLDMVDWMYRWSQPAPKILEQPILPGWTFAINNVNSSAPQTEAEIVAEHSYGRQLGRISDVLALLLQSRDDLRADQHVVDFVEMKTEIDATKTKAAGDRLDLIRADLVALQNGDRDRYETLRAALRRALDETE